MGTDQWWAGDTHTHTDTQGHGHTRTHTQTGPDVQAHGHTRMHGHTPGVAAVRAGPGHPTGIAVATFSAGWGRGQEVQT